MTVSVRLVPYRRLGNCYRGMPMPQKGESDNMPGRRFIYWLATTLSAERQKAGVDRVTVAEVLGINDRTLERFEDVTQSEKGYGRDIDRYVAGYAYMLGEDDSRRLWQMALDKWMSEGSPPDFLEDLPGSAFIRPLRDVRQRQRPVPSGRAGTRHATGSSREAR